MTMVFSPFSVREADPTGFRSKNYSSRSYANLFKKPSALQLRPFGVGDLVPTVNREQMVQQRGHRDEPSILFG
jgi:hypothetical protein